MQDYTIMNHAEPTIMANQSRTVFFILTTFGRSDIDMVIFENIDKAILENIDIDKAILKNSDIDIDRNSLRNINIDKGIIRISI